MILLCNGSLTRWRHRLLWRLARRYISIIFFYTLPRSCTSNMHKSNKMKWFLIFLKQQAENMTDSDFADDLEFLTNTPGQRKSPQHSQEHATEGVGLYLNANKKKCKCVLNKKWQVSKINRPVHILWQQYLIYWKWSHYTPDQSE